MGRKLNVLEKPHVSAWVLFLLTPEAHFGREGIRMTNTVRFEPTDEFHGVFLNFLTSIMFPRAVH